MNGRNRVVTGLLATALVLGCASAEQQATEAVEAADQAVAGLTAETEQVLPQDVAALRDTLALARERLAAGAWEEARTLADSLPAQAESLAARAPAARAELVATWDSLSVAMARNLEALRARLEELGRTRRYPPGLDAESVGAIRQMSDSASAVWSEIEAQWSRGELGAASDRAFDLKARVSEGMIALGMVADDRAWGNARPIGR